MGFDSLVFMYAILGPAQRNGEFGLTLSLISFPDLTLS